MVVQEGRIMYELHFKGHFDAAHRLEDYKGKCNRLHGHRWEVQLGIVGDSLNTLNMLVDFGEVKKALNELLDSWVDHYYLNQTLKEANPTAEYLSKWIYDSMLAKVLSWDLDLKYVEVWESPECSVHYVGGR